MERGGFFRGLLIAILLIAVVGGAAYYAYGAGVAQGLMEGGKLVAPAPATGIAPYPYYGPFFHPFGFGLGAIGCIFPFLFFLLFFALVRTFLWRGHWGHGMHHGHWDNGVPPKFEEWHKRAHEPQPAEK